MQDWPMPLKAALTASAIVWPFMAGLAVVVWSNFRTRAVTGRPAPPPPVQG